MSKAIYVVKNEKGYVLEVALTGGLVQVGINAFRRDPERREVTIVDDIEKATHFNKESVDKFMADHPGEGYELEKVGGKEPEKKEDENNDIG